MQNTNRSLHPTIITAKDFGPTTSITPHQPGCSYFLLVILRISSYSKKTHHPWLLISPARTTECTYRSIFNRGLIFPGWWTSSSPTNKKPENQPTYQPACAARITVIKKTGAFWHLNFCGTCFWRLMHPLEAFRPRQVHPQTWEVSGSRTLMLDDLLP